MRGEMMKKELPKVYANKIDKEIKNNEFVAYSRNDRLDNREIIEEDGDNSSILSKELSGNVNQKIRDIFNSKNYIYKADVVISLKDKKITKRIVGRNNNYLITYDNELIPITEIVDIDYK